MTGKEVRIVRTISIGKQNFASMREKNCFYIDKTHFIKEWWEAQDDVTLIARPRRFGKTFNLSTLECFFSNRYANRRDLFEGLKIWDDEAYRRLQGTYPVISLSFGSIKGSTYHDTRDLIVSAVAKAYQQHTYLKESDCLSEEEKKIYSGFRSYSISFDAGRHIDDQLVVDSLNYLSDYLERYYGKKVIILLDEYDTPLQEAYINGYWEEIVKLLRGMFNATFKDNPHIERAMMTGITKVSKESIFSDLNHLRVVTTTSREYATSFGFTEEEVFSSLDEAGVPEEKEEVKNWYDGFTFGYQKDIYNPWSITYFLKEKQYAPYWADTSSNALVSQLIQRGSLQIKERMERLLQGETIKTRIDEQIVFSELDQGEEKVWSLLLASGYMKVQNRVFDALEGMYTYELALTNKEVHIMFRKLILSWFREPRGNYNQFTKSLLRGEVEDMNAYLQEVLDATVSSFDVKTQPKGRVKLSEYVLLLQKGEITPTEMEVVLQKLKNEKADPESFYHALVLGMLVELRSIYQVKSNRESGRGRYDVMLIPRNPFDETVLAMVIEFKVFDQKREKTLKDTVKRALMQIEEKKYDTELLDMGMKKERIRHYGFGFQGQEVLIMEGTE